jgi:hypothetical protein
MVAEPLELVAVPLERYGVLAFQWQAEELHSALFHALYHRLVNSMVGQLRIEEEGIIYIS